MSLKRYFAQVSSSVDQSSQKKAKQSQVSDLPPLDNDLLPLLDLSSPSLSSHASIREHFDKIAEHLFQRSCLVCCSTKADGTPKRVLYELLEFEFYLIKPDCHSDPFTHDGEDQRLSGAWYFHRVPRRNGSTNSSALAYRSGSRKGLDLTIGTLNSPDPSTTDAQPVPVRGGILLRSLRRLSDSTVISGPSLLVDELLRSSKADDIPELVTEKWHGDISAFRAPSSSLSEDPGDSNPKAGATTTTTLFIGVKQAASPTPPQMYRSPRVGIDLSHPSTRLDPSDRRVRYVSKPYRYFILPQLLTEKGRGQNFLGIYNHCVDVLQISKRSSLLSKITSLMGLKAQTVENYLKTYQEALETGQLEGFIGLHGKGASSSPGTFLQLMGALKCRELIDLE